MLLLGATDGTTARAVSNEHLDLIRPEPLSFDELIVLSDTATPAGGLGAKVDLLLSEPFVSNAAEARGSGARQPVVDGLGPVLRAALWNIDHGTEFDWIRLALSDLEEFKARALRGQPATSDLWRPAERHLRAIQDVDLLIVNEVDLGVAVSAYRDVACELADAFGMNCA